MPLYVDTSAVVKIFAAEPGADEIRKAAAEAGSLTVGWLTPLEFRSALFKKVREGILTADEVRKIIDKFSTSTTPKIQAIPFSSDILKKSIELMDKHGQAGLRSLDCLQIATAAVSGADGFLTSDVSQSEFARTAGLQVQVF